MPSTLTLPPPVIEEHRGILVVRDDLLEGGTKSRVLDTVLDDNAPEYVYASTVYGYAQIALAVAGRRRGKPVTIFCAKRKQRYIRTQQAEAAGARIVEVPDGMLSVVTHRAKRHCERTGAQLVPFGVGAPAAFDALVALARSLPVTPDEVWAVSGSGTLIRALADAWPNAQANAVIVSTSSASTGRARRFVAPESFGQDAKIMPPFPSCSNYDAKAWRFVSAYARPGALFWNVA